MRRYDDPVEVRKGLVGVDAGEGTSAIEGPEQFLWRGKLWKVRVVLAHWVETGSWWQSADARAVIGSDDTGPGDSTGDSTGDLAGDLLGERELWRVEAAAGMRRAPETEDAVPGGGVFDLSFDWADGTWQLVGCLD
ncbi:hypothetical protein ISU10_05980 [Nocardioides agariphilus]|jgi:hypothetical protein|uniref:DUF6504 domain-containing protein n=1 Tax=Nocardioides agariphilus TaxID=433664 RepID=A0A930VKH7_9ACTN|nr:DUF6504 family protein [Nocardioides agariphilus]MBF4767311.1 hypothetical protein [Nocardioides agariphilus]